MLPKKFPKNALSGLTVVAVDDDPGSLGIVSIVLQHHGAKLFTATNGEQGLEVICKVRPDLIITDLSMPRMDGWTMMARVKDDSDLAKIPVVALSAHAMSHQKDDAKAKGFTRYITKPLLPSTFIQELVNVLQDVPELTARIQMQG